MQFFGRLFGKTVNVGHVQATGSASQRLAVNDFPFDDIGVLEMRMARAILGTKSGRETHRFDFDLSLQILHRLLP